MLQDLLDWLFGGGNREDLPEEGTDKILDRF